MDISVYLFVCVLPQCSSEVNEDDGRRGVIDCQRFMQAVEGKNYIEVCLSHGRAAIPMLIQRRR